MTVAQAKQKIHELNRYVYLAETFEMNNIHDQIIKNYAHLGSLQSVADKMQEMGYDTEVEDVGATLRQTSKNDLHRIIRAGYMKRTRSGRPK